MSQNEKAPAVSVFTPTYNRAGVLERAYRSLCAQTCLDFEWVIADDGSTDDTARRVEGWAAEAPFAIRYLPLPHRGKPYAMRDGFAACRGKYLYELDSDDEMTPNAVERGLAIWASLLDPERYHDVNGWGWVPETGQAAGLPFPENMNELPPARQRQLNAKLGKGAGRCGEQRSFRVTEHCRRYPFPIPEELSFVPENVLWDRIYCDYKRYYTNEHFMVYHQEQADSLLKTVKDARPAYFYYIYHFNEIFPHDVSITPRERAVAAASLCVAAQRCGYPLKKLRAELTRGGDRALCTACWLPARAVRLVVR